MAYRRTFWSIIGAAVACTNAHQRRRFKIYVTKWVMLKIVVNWATWKANKFDISIRWSSKIVLVPMTHVWFPDFFRIAIVCSTWAFRRLSAWSASKSSPSCWCFASSQRGRSRKFATRCRKRQLRKCTSMHWNLNLIVGNTFLVSCNHTELWWQVPYENFRRILNRKWHNLFVPFIAVILAGVNITHICTQIKSAVDEEQNKVIWVPVTSS